MLCLLYLLRYASYAMLRYATLCYATLRYSMRCYAMLCDAMRCYAMLCDASYASYAMPHATPSPPILMAQHHPHDALPPPDPPIPMPRQCRHAANAPRTCCERKRTLQ